MRSVSGKERYIHRRIIGSYGQRKVKVLNKCRRSRTDEETMLSPEAARELSANMVAD